jgi:hypothetical protein
MTELSNIHEGGCLCGAVRYRVTGEPTALVLCHCRSCRRAAGAPSLAWAIFRAADFSFTRGEPKKFRSSPGVDRTFCGNCGTSLGYIDADRPEVADVTAASLDEPDRFAPQREIWVGEKIAWETLHPALPHYPRSSKTSQPLP